MLIKNLTHVQITLKMAERSVVCVGCEVNLTEKPKNLGAE